MQLVRILLLKSQLISLLLTLATYLSVFGLRIILRLVLQFILAHTAGELMELFATFYPFTCMPFSCKEVELRKLRSLVSSLTRGRYIIGLLLLLSLLLLQR